MQFIDYQYIKASQLGIGTSAYGSKMSKRQAFRVLHMLKEQGVNYIDTANSYGLGMSEGIIGDFLKKNRSQYFISTKVGIKSSPLPIYKKWLLPLVRRTYNLSFLKKTTQKQSASSYQHAVLTVQDIENSIAQSLHNLKTDYIDQLLIHNNYKIYLSQTAVVDLLEDYKQKGIIRHIGITIEEPLDTEGVAVLEKNKLFLNTIQLPFSQYPSAQKGFAYINYFSIFNKNNGGNEQNDLSNIAKSHVNGHFISLMTSEKRVLQNCNMFN